MDALPSAPRQLTAPLSDDRPLWDLHASEQYLLWLAAADELGLFGLLEQAGASADVVSSRLAIGTTAAECLLGFMAALGFVIQFDGRYSLTQVARDFLVPSSPYYRGAWLEAVRHRPRLTYDMVHDALFHNQPISERYWNDDDATTQGRAMMLGMHALTFAGGPAMAARGNFSDTHRLLDVGGGAGGMSIALALHYPALRCTVLDLSHACAVASELITAYEVYGRVDVHIADAIHDAWPNGYDAILLSHILDCFDASHCQSLLHKAHACLPSGGRLYIHEMLLQDAKDGPLGVIALSLYDHLGSRGQQWSAGELKTMAAAAGFTVESVVPTFGYNVLLSAAKA